MTLLTNKQTRTFGPAPVKGYGLGALLTATVRHDDSCGNGHNTFSITGKIVTPESAKRRDIAAGGMLHAEIAATFPQLAPLLKWHLCSAPRADRTGDDRTGDDGTGGGPMHYVSSTLYYLGRCLPYRDAANLQTARKSRSGRICPRDIYLDEIIRVQGWTDTTVLGLLWNFLEEIGRAGDACEFLAQIAEEENSECGD